MDRRIGGAPCRRTRGTTTVGGVTVVEADFLEVRWQYNVIVRFAYCFKGTRAATLK
jgi:hypothetical protein